VCFLFFCLIIPRSRMRQLFLGPVTSKIGGRNTFIIALAVVICGLSIFSTQSILLILIPVWAVTKGAKVRENEEGNRSHFFFSLWSFHCKYHRSFSCSLPAFLPSSPPPPPCFLHVVILVWFFLGLLALCCM